MHNSYDPPLAQSFGLATTRARPSVMTVAHRHDDIELNFAPTPIEYLIDGVRTTIPAYTAVAFWAARPHQLLADTSPPWLHWLTVPLKDLLGYGLPARFTGALLRGELVHVNDAGRHPIDDRLLQWAEDLAMGTADRRTIVELEVQAYLRRAGASSTTLARAVVGSKSGHDTVGAAQRVHSIPGGDAAGAPVGLRHAALMAEYISANGPSAITVGDVARAAHLHPNHAMSVFRRSIGITIGDYLALSRVAHAQRLLITTNQPVSTIGHAAGFRSASQFYERFGRSCGVTPAAYRRRHIASTGPAPSA